MIAKYLPGQSFWAKPDTPYSESNMLPRSLILSKVFIDLYITDKRHGQAGA
jgi:hypothetical protein